MYSVYFAASASRLRFHVILLTAVGLYASGCASTPAVTVPAPSSYEAVISAAEAKGFSGVVVVQKGDRTLLLRGYGLADREAKRPYTTTTIHDIGSITKAFTGAAIAKLVDEGKIDLSAPVRTYLPDAAEPVASVTVQQLLSHQSGMVEYCGADGDDATKEAMLKRCMAAPLRFAPGTKTAYSNPGFSVLGMIVEARTGMSLDDYLKRNFFVPLEMPSTGYAVPGAEQAAIGYDDGKRHVPFSGAKVLNGRHWNVAGNGGMVSSAKDMLRWYRALSRPGGGLDETLRQRLISTFDPRPSAVTHGYAWTFLSDAEGRLLSMSHAGSDSVFYSYFYWHRPSDTFFYLNGNVGEDEIVPVVRELRRIASAH